MYSNGLQMNGLDSFDFSVRSMEGQNVDVENSSAINISDVIEVIKTDPAFGQSTGMQAGNGLPGIAAASSSPSGAGSGVRRTSQETSGACVKIIEQPASKALRFRYECEGRSAGSIPGVNSTSENKTYPTIQIEGYVGRAVVVVSCVTKDHPYKPHPHNLVGKEGCKKGVCTVEVNNETMITTFANLGIQCVKRKDIEEALRIREEIRVDPFRTGFSHRTQPSSIDLNSVRLCFQAFLEGPQRGKFTIPLQPIVSEPIYDKKAMADLVICKLSHCSGSVAGGNEIILLCEKVAKEDISVRFYEEKDGQIVWEGFGDFTPTQVHKQVAISFRTPRYRTIEIDQPVKVLIQLRRPSDGATSEALPFQLTPLDSDPAILKRKRQKFNNGNDVLRQLQETEQIRIHISESSSMPVKREPAETSPNPYLMYSTARNVYSSRTPSPLEYAVTSSSGGGIVYTAATAVPGSSTGQQVLFPMPPSVGQYHHVYSPTSPSLLPPQPTAHQVQLNYDGTQQILGGALGGMGDVGTTLGNDLLDMDTQQYSVELSFGRFDSKELADLNLYDAAGNLSANLSNNLTLNDNKNTAGASTAAENMTDSFTRLATTALNEFCGDIYPGGSGT